VGERPTLTAVRRARPGKVELEVDGNRWRIVPDEVVLRCGLTPGLELDRRRLRQLRRELRHTEALSHAVRTVTRRDISTRRLRERLAARGVRADEAEDAVAALTAAGAVDDARTAAGRAHALAQRGWGDDALTARLVGEGFAAADVRAALAQLRPERERAAALAATARDARAAWKLLSRRGFSQESVEDVVGVLDADR
jgi:SOS response regulatory protein OraA/RecX